ncbi:MAG: T9SS type A sorting domain-containing protein [Chitinophagales bacterium]|jgi:hypothetical protein|nr:T9SS type A sorting domain-containing protein [Sphingobacteriales bacterium]
MSTNSIMYKVGLTALLVWHSLPSMLAQNAGVLHIQGGANISSTHGAILTLDNAKLSNQGELRLPESNLIFKGNLPTASQSIEGSGSTMAGYMQVHKLVDDIQLRKSISVSRVLSLVSGGIELISGDIDLGSTGELQFETTMSRIYGSGGEIKTTRLLGANSNLHPANLGAEMTSAIAMGTTQILRGHKSWLVNGENSAFRYYKINPTVNSGLNASLAFNYFDQELNGVDEGSMQIWYSPNQGLTWIQTKAAQRDVTNNWIQVNKVDRMGWFTLAPPCSPVKTALTMYVSLDQTFFFKGQQRNTTGVYIDSQLSVIGCDSIITLNLFVKPMSSLPAKDTIVRGIDYFSLNGKIYTTNQIVRDTLRGLVSDSIRVYNVIINKPLVLKSSIVECQIFYDWRGKKYTQNGTYRDTVWQKYTDTVHEIILVLKGMDLSVTFKEGVFVSNCTSCTSFQWYVCLPDGRRSPIHNATSRSLKTNTEGEYAVDVEGIEGCKGSSACVNKLTALSIVSAQNIKILVYPNPFKNRLYVTLDKLYKEIEVSLLDMSGKRVFAKKVARAREFELELESYAAGNYMLVFENSDEGVRGSIKITKE